MRAYIQYLTVFEEWAVTERMSIEEARIRCANMDPRQEAFIRICN